MRINPSSCLRSWRLRRRCPAVAQLVHRLGESLRLDKSANIAGQPVKRIRDLLRRMEAVHWSDQAIADFFHLDETQANALATELVARGLLEESNRRSNDHR